MMHHLFGPHLFGPPLLHGVPNILVLIALAVGVWWILNKKKQPASGPETEMRKEQDSNAALQAEVQRLKKENELLQTLLRKELQSK